ncbi:unnamed protein product [Clonostachys chloroleuca]|uniref:Cell wall proline rich protein n=1 Tax=Clonostachys chloroleuca TaxID=1926264 RepID=A0AA35LSH3_9HYPO|nr:unnamed protein product [Clonostachys chloroleuca]
MATAYGPEPFAHPSVNALVVEDSMAANSYSRAAPPPNPTFSFPARLDDEDMPSPRTPSTPTFPRRTGRRPMSAVEPMTESYQLTAEPLDNKSMGRAALPAFSFNPGASLPPDPEGLSPDFLPSSPQLPRTIPPGPRGGHRRGGSEFVGGRIREGNSIAVLSGSPTKQELVSGSPSLMPPRRGHRRGLSSAMSTNDLSLLSPPHHDFSFKGSSAPNSPTNFDHTPTLPLILPDTFKSDAEEIPKEETPSFDTPMAEPVEEPSTPDPKPASKARVGFSDTLEFIPRPLSLVSTDTSSTVTVRPSHNVSGSISSFVSASSPDHRGTSSPVLSRSPSRNTNDSRPSTAGAILDRIPQENRLSSSPRRRNSIPSLLDIAEANKNLSAASPSPSKTSKRWSFFGLDSFSNHSSSPTKARPHSSSSGDSASRAVSGGSSSEHESESQVEAAESKKRTPKTASEKKDRRKRRKKVKGWAGSILPRKPKNQGDKQSKYAVRPPTPPSSVLPPEIEEEVDAIPNVASITISPTSLVIPPRSSVTAKSSSKSDEVLSPMIDLDAALGPFNTPLPNNPEWDAAQRAAGNAGKRRLHSAQGMRGFSGPGMHYHRRAESAPDLPPFDAARAGIHRFGSSSTMADVFEEDEEDDTTSSMRSISRDSTMSDDSSGEITPPAVVQSDPVKDAVIGVRRKSSGLSERESSSADSIRVRRSKASLHDTPIAEEPTTIRFNSNTFQSESKGSPHLSSKSPMSGVGPFELGPPQAPYAGGSTVSPHSANFPPSVPRSPVSIDTQRLSTAPSSVHEENSFHSLLLGEPGPEVRLSVDYDIPSLTSSNSTTTRESCFVPQPRMSQPTLRQPRPLSVSSTAFGRRRSSLASLSRLISSSHGERSKLSEEVTLDPEAESKKAKGGKAKRLSKLMQFWKTNKDTTTSSKRS